MRSLHAARRVALLATLTLPLASLVGLAAPAVAASQTLTTTFASDIQTFNGNSFDLTAAVAVDVESLDLNLRTPAGSPASVSLWTRSGTSNGFETTGTGWTLAGTVQVVSAGSNTPTAVPITFDLDAGLTGVMTYSPGGINYTNGSTTITSGPLTLTTRAGTDGPPGSTQVASPRIVNTTLHFAESATVSFSSTPPDPAHVGETYLPVAASSVGTPVTYSIDPATTQAACLLAQDGQTLFFQHSGTCVVAADAPGDATHSPGHATQSITVVAAQSDLASLAISPLDASTTAGVPVHYSASGTDSLGNIIPGQQATFSYTPTAGGASTVCPDGDCSPQLAGTYTVTASAPGSSGPVTDSTTLTVLADGVAALTITPEDATTAAGTPIQYAVAGTDQFGNPLPDQTAVSDVVATPVGGGTPVTCVAGLCDLTSAGLYSVGASQAGPGAPAGDATGLTVTPAALDSISLSPVAATSTAGSAVVYSVVGHDTYGNVVPDVAATVTATRGPVTIACPAGVCSPTVAGTWTIDAVVGAVSDATTLDVTPAALSRLTLDPDVVTVTPGTAVAYTVTAVDTYGNDLGDQTSAASVTARLLGDAGPAIACPDATCTLDTAGTYRVTATRDDAVGTATLVVSLPQVELTLDAFPATTYGDDVTPVATATSPDGDPTGAVQFSLDGTAVGAPVALDGSGTATGPVLSGVHAGVHTVGAAFTADPAGSFAGASAERSLVVAKAPTTTALTVTDTSLSAEVDGGTHGTPDGSVTFAIDGAEVATVPLTAGRADWDGDTTGGHDSVVTATYSGAADYLPSADSSARLDPTVVTTTSGTPRNGWYDAPVVVSFDCTAGSAPVTCPDPVTLDTEGAGQTVTRTVVAADGGIAVVTSDPVSLDLTAPTASIVGPRAGSTYHGTAPAASCRSTDALSGLESCEVTTTGRFPGSLRSVVTATDLAGNSSTTRIRYRVLDLWVTRSQRVAGAWNAPVGGFRTLQLVAAGYPDLHSVRAIRSSPFRFAGRLGGVGHWTARLEIPRGVKPGTILRLRITRADGTVQRVKIRAVRR